MNKIYGLAVLLLVVLLLTAAINPGADWVSNFQNLQKRTALYGILGVGVAFVIITGGIDLSIGSVVALVGVLLIMTVNAGVHPALAVVLMLVVSAGLGWIHGFLITRVRLQPFVVTLCGLLIYRGLVRYIGSDETQSLDTWTDPESGTLYLAKSVEQVVDPETGITHVTGWTYEGLKALAQGRPLGAPLFLLLLGLGTIVIAALFLRAHGQPAAIRARARVAIGAGALSAVTGVVGLFWSSSVLGQVRVPTPFLIMTVVAVLAGTFLGCTVLGRHLFALGKNEEAARFSGIATKRLIVLAYVLCALTAGMGGILFALAQPAIQPAAHGNFFELYAIAAAVLGGCSLRGGEGSILGVVLGSALLRMLLNAINLLEMPGELEFTIIGAVILIGVSADELVRRTLARRRAARLAAARLPDQETYP